MLAVALIVLIGLSALLFVRAAAMPRTRINEQVRDIQAYGFSGGPAAAAEPEGPGLGDLFTQVGDALGKRLSSFRPEVLRREILSAGLYRLTPGALLGYRVLTGAIFGLLGLSIGLDQTALMGTIIVVVMAWVGWIAPLAFVRRRARFRLEQIDRALPDIIDMIVITIQGGLGLGASLRVAASRTSGPLGDELALLLQEQRMGRSLEEAMHSMLERADTPAMRAFVRSVTQGESLGVSIGAIMRTVSLEMRKRRRSSVEEQAQKMPVKILFPLVFLIFPALLIVLMGPTLYSLGETLGGS